MISLQALLAVGAKSIPKIILIVAIVVMAVAFVLGMIKGFRKISWGGLFLSLAAVGFTLCYKFFRDNNPFGSALQNTRSLWNVVWAFTLALSCAAGSLLLCGICAAIFRERKVWVKNIYKDQYGFEYEYDDVDDVPVDETVGKTLVVKGRGSKSFLCRLCGGIVGALNAAVVLSVLVGIFLLIVNGTALQFKSLGDIFDVKLGAMMLNYASAYALDFLTVSIIFGLGVLGYKGFVHSVRVVLCLSIILVVFIGFAIPIVDRTENMYLFRQLIVRCCRLFKSLSRGVIYGKLLAGGLLASFGVVIVLILVCLLKKLAIGIDNRRVAFVVDGTIAVIAYLAIAAVLCAVLWGALYLLDYCGVFKVSEIFSEKAGLAKECFAGAEGLLKSFADKYLLRFAA